MYYPTLEEVKKAGREELRVWLDGLPMPGYYATGAPDHAALEAKEHFILQLILRKYRILESQHPTQA